jgi:rhodanese-related sulfurtransferase
MPPKPITVSSITYIKPSALSNQLLDPSASSKVAVVDVRDNDYLGGHIKNSVHAPIDQFDARMPELLRTLKDKDRVVFHCMLSQQRGPSAALSYARAKAEQVAKERKAEGGDGKSDDDEDGKDILRIGGQEVCVLQGGFGQWQSRYGKDKRLTDGYVKELWESVLG